MKKILFVFVLLLSILYNGLSQPVIGYEEDLGFHAPREVSEDGCFNVIFYLGQNLIVLGCPESQPYEYESESSIEINTVKTCLSGSDCIYKIRLFLNDKEVSEIEIKPWRYNGNDISIKIPIDYASLSKNLTDYKKSTANLKIKISKVCSDLPYPFEPHIYEYTVFESEKEIQVRKDGETYITDKIVGHDNDDLCSELYNDDQVKISEASICCNGLLEFSYIENIINGEKIDFTGSIVAGSLAEVSIKYSVSEYYINENVRSIARRKPFHPKENTCVYPGIRLKLLQHERARYIVNCDGPDQLDDTYEIERYLEYITSEPMDCYYNYPCDHQDPDPLFRREDGGFLREIANACSSSIYVDLRNPVSGMHYEYEWIDQDGTTYNTKDITNVPYGKYELTIYDQCCNEYKYTYNLCDETIYGNWYYDGQQYCREVTCNCYIALRDGTDNTYTMCVTPHRYDPDWSFDDYRKKCTKHAYWTDQNGVEIDLTDAVNKEDINAGDEKVVKEPIIDDHYDNTTKQCVRDYYCESNGIGYNHTVQPPTSYGANWTFQNFDNTCHREVYCFGEFNPVEEEQIIPAEINWTFNLVTGMCEATVYCDGFQQYGAYVPPHFPYSQTGWVLYTPDNTHCQKKVTCELGEEETVVADMTINTSNTDGYCTDPNKPMHVIWYCNNEFVSQECQSAGQARELINNSNYKSTKIDKINGLLTIYPNPYQDKVNITIVSEKKSKLKIDLFSITGKKIFSKTEEITKGENSFLLNDINDLNKGMYFLHLYDNQGISYTYKLIKE